MARAYRNASDSEGQPLVEPLFFGENENLYGVVHTPASGTWTQAVVICGPVGQESLRLHRSMVWLAGLLTQQGIAVLRFDYSGTGDSAGEFAAMTLEHWRKDTLAAVKEAGEQFGRVPLSIVAVRVGALAVVPENLDTKLKSLLFWEPCQSGAVFLDELLVDIANVQGSQSNFVDAESNLHHNGFTYSKPLQQSLRAAALNDQEYLTDKLGSVIHLQKSPEFSDFVPADANAVALEQHRCAADFSWTDVDIIGSALLPTADLGKIVNLLSR